ncbi:MAG: nucleoside monophosphate kinase [Alphaproteobacteria bacterium]|nr:nucleoside monophosphate kinase [Alphaproteobacteria bacterium]
MKKKIIVMMGGQGVGKGTFAKMLCNRSGFNHIDVGGILRTAPADSEVGKTIAMGNLVPDELLFDLIKEKITPDNNTVLDGFPRKLSQAEWLVKNYAKDYDIHILYLTAPEEILMSRINKRIREGGGRADDARSDVIRRRLDTYKTVTVPAIEWLRTAPGIKFSTIDAAGHVDDNFAEIIAALKKQ